MKLARKKYILGVVVILLLSACLANYLAGFFFLLFSKTNPLKTTFITYYQYWYYYHMDPSYEKRFTISFIFALVIAYGLPLFLILAWLRNPRALFGAARFAKAHEIKESGLLDLKGIIVGKWNNRYLMLGGQQFVLLAAPTRSGKGVGIVIPNLLNFPDSAIVLDIKQENFKLTAGFRQKHGQAVFLFNPFAEDLRTARYNPLDYVRDGNFRVGDLITIGEVFYPQGGSDPFFNDQARNLFLGLGLYLCETPTLPRTLGEMLRQSSSQGQPIKNYLHQLIAERRRSPQPLSSECVEALYRFTSTSDNTLASILASFNAPLGIWANPIVDAATSCNDFDLREVRKKRMTIYVGITPDHLAEARRLINVMFSQLIHLNTKESPKDNPELKYQCLLLMDEFTALDKITILATAVSYIASFNLRLLPIIQSISQLTSVYGEADARTFITNHALQILYAPREQRDANEFSEMLGYETVKGKSLSRQLGGRSGRNESISDQRRALLLPQEIKEIGQQKEMIIFENTKPILCDKIQYYADPIFTTRLLPEPSVLQLNMDLHRAKIQKRLRPVTEADLENLDIDNLDLDHTRLKIPADGQICHEDVPVLTEAILEMWNIHCLTADDSESIEPQFSIEKINISTPSNNKKKTRKKSKPILDLKDLNRHPHKENEAPVTS